MRTQAEKSIAKTVSLKAITGTRPSYRINKLALPTLQGYTFVKFTEITSLKADGSYTEVNLVNGETFIVSRILKDLATQINLPDFLRVHRSHIINLNHVSQYFKGKCPYLLMDNGTKIDVSSSGKKTLLEALNLF